MLDGELSLQKTSAETFIKVMDFFSLTVFFFSLFLTSLWILIFIKVRSMNFLSENKKEFWFVIVLFIIQLFLRSYVLKYIAKCNLGNF